jgi:hypothetical protein
LVACIEIIRLPACFDKARDFDWLLGYDDAGQHAGVQARPFFHYQPARVEMTLITIVEEPGAPEAPNQSAGLRTCGVVCGGVGPSGIREDA